MSPLNKLYTSVQSPTVKKAQLFRGRQLLFCPFLLIIATFLTGAVAAEVRLWTKLKTITKPVWMRMKPGLVSCSGGKAMDQLKLFHIISPLKCSVTILRNCDAGIFCSWWP